MASDANHNPPATQRAAPMTTLPTFGKSNGLAPFGVALSRLVPTGSIADTVALFGGRASWSAIDHWRRGRRQAPEWARQIVAKQFELLWREFQTSMQTKPRPNNVDALRRYWAKEKGRRLSRP